MALRAIMDAAQKAHPKVSGPSASVAILYRSCIKELPRVLTIYDVDMPIRQARDAIKFHFRKHGTLIDGRVIGLLLAKGYMELEETLMQWKQKTHLLRVLEPMDMIVDNTKNLSPREKFLLGYDDEDWE